ncbi:MAG: hypothetical protein DRG31_07135, partial [Deltaproteobacteria bacterium]
ALLLEIFLPYFTSFLVGSPSAGIAISYPVLLSLLGKLSEKAAALIMASAYLGYLASPLHLCMALTVQYLKIPLEKVYRYMIPSLAPPCLGAIFIYFIV